MKYLLYGIWATPKQPTALLGIDEQPITLIHHQSLTAAVSKIDPAKLTTEVPLLLAYNQVIESLHNIETTIPMRYGSLFDNETQIIQWLDKNLTHYKELLQKLNGCVEMGIRLLLPTPPEPPTITRSGRNYLTARQNYYSDKDQQQNLIKQINNQFSGCFRYTKHCAENRYLSLYFLVPKNQVEKFRSLFQTMDKKHKQLLSGPWPPYNFVISEETYVQ